MPRKIPAVMEDDETPAPGDYNEIEALEAALRREQKKVALVQEVGRALSTIGDLDVLLGLIVDKVTELMEADRATLYLVSDDGTALWSKVVRGGELVEIRLRMGEGLAGWVAETRELVNIPDAYVDPRFQHSVDQATGYRTRTILGVPMVGAVGGLVGVLQVLNKVEGAFSRGDEELLQALASQAAIAIENAKLYHSLRLQNRELSEARRDLERRQSELNVLYEVEKQLSQALDLDDLLARILAQAIAVLGGGTGSIALVESNGSLRFRTVQGPAAANLLDRTLPFGTGLLGWSIAHKRPLIANDPSGDPRHEARVALESGVTPAHIMVAPLIDDEVVIGGIEIIDQRRTVRDGSAWTEADLKLLVMIAARAASAIGFASRRHERSKSDRLAAIGRMVAGLLHDLKTPMTIISGYGQLMAGSNDPEQRNGYVEQIQHQFDLMAAMTGEVLAFARGASDLVVRKVYINRFAVELETQLSVATAGRKIELRVEANYRGIAYFDEHKLLRVFHNLVRNAVEAMPGGGSIVIAIDRNHGAVKEGDPGRSPPTDAPDSTDDGRDDLVCSIRDTGPGIPAEVQGRLFELFATGRKEGTGLGLAIVKKIVEDHRGTIRVDSGAAGTTFILTLPMQRLGESN